MEPSEIEALITEALPDCSARVSSDDLTHYEALIVSSAFTGKRRLQRHQLVYAALGELVGREIHALSIRALTPEELAEQGAQA
jgi:acid stress-induced BolA-like protein IbaG/YrbA